MNYAIILAGGIGSRMRMSNLPKQYIEVYGKPIIMYTLEQFEQCAAVDRIVIVAARQWVKQISDWNTQYSITKHWGFAFPGSIRQISILNGVNVCMMDNPADGDVVVIHDAVRPLVPTELIESCIQTARQYGGCMPVLPLTDTVYESLDGTHIHRLADRSILYAGQAPEAFRLKEYAQRNSSCTKAELESYQGSSQVAYQHGMEVHMIPGAEINFKITTSADILRFRAICANSLNEVRI